MFFYPRYHWTELTVAESVSSEALILNLLINKKSPAYAGPIAINLN